MTDQSNVIQPSSDVVSRVVEAIGKCMVGSSLEEQAIARRVSPMTDPKSEIVGLAERCEKATRPSDHLDADIARMLGWTQHSDEADPVRIGHPALWWAEPGCEWSTCSVVPRYTASLDAAMTLVPKGWGFATGEYVTPHRRPFARTFPPDFANSPLEHQESNNCATAALALCAAALKARATLKEYE